MALTLNGKHTPTARRADGLKANFQLHGGPTSARMQKSRPRGPFHWRPLNEPPNTSMQNLRLHRSQPLRKFAEALLTYKTTLYRVTIIAPWVSFTDDASAATNQIVYALSEKNIPVLLITRRPTEAWHQIAVDVFQS